MPPDRMEVHAADLVNGSLDVILATGDAAVRAAQRATTSIPILAVTDDMVGQGFVHSLSRPGGNITDVTILSSEAAGGFWSKAPDEEIARRAQPADTGPCLDALVRNIRARKSRLGAPQLQC